MEQGNGMGQFSYWSGTRNILEGQASPQLKIATVLTFCFPQCFSSKNYSDDFPLPASLINRLIGFVMIKRKMVYYINGRMYSTYIPTTVYIYLYTYAFTYMKFIEETGLVFSRTVG